MSWSSALGNSIEISISPLAVERLLLCYC